MSFKEQRKRAGLTQMEVAKQLGVTDSAVNQWETGKTTPNTKRLSELARLYNCTVDELLRGE